MNKIILKIDERSFEYSKSDQITGIIFFDFGTRQFPEKRWNDFVVVILNWWLSALNDIMLGRVDNGELRFMDGPFCLRVKKPPNGICSIECLEVGTTESVEYSTEISLVGLASTVLHAAKKVEAVCAQNGWDDNEIRELGRKIEELIESSTRSLGARLEIGD